MEDVQCPYCHEVISGVEFPAHEAAHRAIRPDGQQAEYVTLPESLRDTRDLVGVPKVYFHRSCGVATGMPEEIIRSYLQNPYLYLADATYCCGCQTHVPMRECVWTETGEDLQAYTDKLRAARPDMKPTGAQATHVETGTVTARLSYFFLIAIGIAHVFTAGIGSAMLANVIWGNIDRFPYFFPFLYIALVGFSAVLVYGNGRWTVDGQHIYKGMAKTPFISIAEIEHAQIGLPENWLSKLTPLNPLLAVAMKNAQREALLVKLTGNRWFIWQFMGMVNRKRFVEAVLARSPSLGEISIPAHVARKLSIAKTGQIVSG